MLRTNVERLYAGSARQLSFRDFNNFWNLYVPHSKMSRRARLQQSTDDASTPFMHIWMDEHGNVRERKTG